MVFPQISYKLILLLLSLIFVFVGAIFGYIFHFILSGQKMKRVLMIMESPTAKTDTRM